MGQEVSESFVVGEVFNAVLIDSTHHSLAHQINDKFISILVFASDNKILNGTISRGQLVVKNREHVREQEFKEKYNKTVSTLFA
jgi:cytosine/adenosine deaminase-related metal-dependent hydrolase